MWMALFPCAVFSQLIDNSRGISLVDDHRFNPAFVRANKVSEISGSFSSKRESDIIRESGERITYEFDRAGRLVKVETSRKIRGQREFNAIVYRYDRDGLLLDRIVADVNGATSYRFTYDDQRRVISETCSRMESPRDTLLETGPKRTEIYTEHIRYTELENGEKRTTYNSYDKPYKEEWLLRDEHGYLREHRTRFITNNRMSFVHFEYNERGLLSEKIVRANLSNPDTLQFNYVYDDAGNLLEAYEKLNGESIRRIEYLYDESNWLMKARLAKDEATEFIRIAQYKTIFFE